jgi:hypothetical protein
VLEHPSNMRPRRPGSSQLSCHNQTSQLSLIARRYTPAGIRRVECSAISF